MMADAQGVPPISPKPPDAAAPYTREIGAGLSRQTRQALFAAIGVVIREMRAEYDAKLEAQDRRIAILEARQAEKECIHSS